MYARMLTVIVKGITEEKWDKAIKNYQEIVPPSVRQMEGFEKAAMLVDREGERVLSLTFWRDKESCDAGVEQSGRLAQEVMQKSEVQGDVKMDSFDVPVFSE